MPKPTPGPWSRNIPPASKYPVVFAGRNTHVASVCAQKDPAVQEANLRLILRAPELLDLLKTARPHLDPAGGSRLPRTIDGLIAEIEGRG